MKSIDIKSLLIGILGTAMVLVLFGFSLTPKYQIACMANKCLVTNTSTGKSKILKYFGEIDVPEKISDAYFKIGAEANH